VGPARRARTRRGTGCWFALGTNARAQLDDYLERYLGFMGPAVASQLAKMVTIDSASRLREAVRAIEDTGADELSLVATTLDPEEIDRVVDAIG